MNRWRVDGEGQRARRCAIFKTAIAAAVKMAAPGVDWITFTDCEGWTAFQINIDWATGQIAIDGRYSWNQYHELKAALAPVLAVELEGAP